MERHLIIGAGNLGLDLELALKESGCSYVRTIATKLTTDDYASIFHLHKPDYVWITAGAGSVESCNLDPSKAIKTHVNLVLDVLTNTKAKVICFSTNYAVNEQHPTDIGRKVAHPTSFYVDTKIMMESVVRRFGVGRAWVVRVANLYGSHYPEKCFYKKIEGKKDLTLPVNEMVPTSTKILAKKLVDNLNAITRTFNPIVHAVPEGSTNAAEYARLILGPSANVNEAYEDLTRGKHAQIGCSHFPWESTWLDDWRKYVQENR